MQNKRKFHPGDLIAVKHLDSGEVRIARVACLNTFEFPICWWFGHTHGRGYFRTKPKGIDPKYDEIVGHANHDSPAVGKFLELEQRVLK